MIRQEIKILHDFDTPYLSGRYALRRGLGLILYAISKKLPILRCFAKQVYRECYEYCYSLAEIDRMVGVQSHFGIKDEVISAFPTLRSELEALGFQVYRHHHRSRDSVDWDPRLDVGRESWFFDQEYSRNRKIPEILNWAVFHADYPFLISAYINFLHQAIREGRISQEPTASHSE